MKYTLLALSVAALATTLPACHKKDVDPQPTICFPEPLCYAGTVVGATCMDGVLIDVDAAYPIGAPARIHDFSGNYTQYNNIIAVANTADFSQADTTGRHVYFTYTPATQPWSGLCCFANDAVPNIPHLVLSNVSITACQPTTEPQ
jgi:hypothetical protein